MTFDKKRGKADFRAQREMLGFSQDEVAQALHVQTVTVKKWESEKSPNPVPVDAWEWIDSMEAIHYIAVENAVNQVKDVEQEVGDAPRVITLTYFRSQDDYNRYGRDKGSFVVVNTRTRAVAAELRRLKYEVHFEYPDSEANLYSRATMGDED